MTTFLHTADWHLGANLYNEVLDEDHELFFNWLTTECIPEVKPQVLIISGDVFDKANPSINARKLYFKFLAKLIDLNIKQVIITAGNHDSASMLEAPKELLEYLNIHIVGNAPSQAKDVLIPIKGTDDEIVAIVAAVPFLRDQDVRFSQLADSEESRESSLRKGISDYFNEVYEAASDYKNQGIPLICMGHLYAAGVTISDSERPVQIGNLADVGADCFPAEKVDYVALGHIHRPQNVGGTNHIWYSGSPIALSFSEWKQEKSLRVIKVDGSTVTSEKKVIPLFRNLIRLEGTFAEVMEKERKLTNAAQLPAYLDIAIVEQDFDVSISKDIAGWIQEISALRKDVHKVASYKYNFINRIQRLSKLTEGISLEETDPLQVFKKMLEAKNAAPELADSCTAIFHEIFAQIQNEEN